MKKIYDLFLKVNTVNLLIVIFIISIILPLISLILQDYKTPLLSDELDYTNLAKDLLAGKGFYCPTLRAGFIKMPNIRHPFYPFFMAVVFLFTHKSILAVRLVQILIQGLTCLVIFLISQRLFADKLISFCSSIAWAIYPLAISHSLLLISETLFTFLLCLSILFILRYTHSFKMQDAFFSGLFLGFSALTKSFILLFIPFLFIWFVLVTKRRVFKKIMNFSLIIFFILLTILPWLIRNYIVLGDYFFIASGGGLSFYRYNNKMTLEVINTPLRVAFPFTDKQKEEISALSEPKLDAYLYKLGWQFIKSNPKDFLKIRLNELNNFWHLWPATPQKFRHYYLKQKANRNIKDVFIDRTLDNFMYRLKDSYLLYILKILYHSPYNILFLGMFVSLCLGFTKDKQIWKNSILLFFLIFLFNVVYIFHHGTDRYRLPIDPYVFMLGFYGLSILILPLKQNNDKSA